jgi:MFS family permease
MSSVCTNTSPLTFTDKLRINAVADAMLRELEALLPFFQLVLGMLLILFGRQLVRFGALVAAGSVGAYLVWRFLGNELSGLLVTVVLILGFAAFGLLGLVLLRIGIGIAAGALIYLIASSLGLHWFYALVLSLLALALALLWHTQALALLTAMIGGLLVHRGLSWLPLDQGLVVMIVAGLVALGLRLQLRRR